MRREARAVIDAARRVVEVLPEEGLELADLIAATNLPGDVVRRAVRLLEGCGVAWEEPGAVYPAPNWIKEGPVLIAWATRMLEALPPGGCHVADLADRAEVSLIWAETIIDGLYAAGLIRWAPGPRVRPLDVAEAP